MATIPGPLVTSVQTGQGQQDGETPIDDFANAIYDSLYPFTGIRRVEVCPYDNMPAPVEVTDRENFFLATLSGVPVLMVRQPNGSFTSQLGFIADMVLSKSGEIFNGSGVLDCNWFFNDPANGLQPELFDRPGGGIYRWGVSTDVGSAKRLTVPDLSFPYDPKRELEMSVFMKWLEETNTGLPPETLLMYPAPLDRDRKVMIRHMFYPSAVIPKDRDSAGTDIVLTQPLAPGDTVVHLNDVSFWDDRKTNYTYRLFRVMGYKDQSGNPYFEYSRYIPHTRWVSTGLPDQSDWGAFRASGVNLAAKTITLVEPWPDYGLTHSAGTSVYSSHLGSTFQYVVSETKAEHVAQAGEDEWRLISAMVPRAADMEVFPTEAAFAKFGLLFNYWANSLDRPNINASYRLRLDDFSMDFI